MNLIPCKCSMNVHKIFLIEKNQLAKSLIEKGFGKCFSFVNHFTLSKAMMPLRKQGLLGVEGNEMMIVNKTK